MLAGFYGLWLALMLVMRFAPHSWLGSVLNRQLVERPLQFAAGLERHHLIYFVIMSGMIIGGGEVIAILGPELVAAYALNSAIYFDAILVAYTLAAVSFARNALRYTRVRLHGGRRVRRLLAARRRRVRRVRTARAPANDDGGPAVMPLAA